MTASCGTPLTVGPCVGRFLVDRASHQNDKGVEQGLLRFKQLLVFQSYCGLR